MRGSNDSEPAKGAASAARTPSPGPAATSASSALSGGAAPPKGELPRSEERNGDLGGAPELRKALSAGAYAEAVTLLEELGPESATDGEKALGRSWLALELGEFPKAAEAANAARLEPSLRSEAERLYSLAFRAAPEAIPPAHFLAETPDWAAFRARYARAQGLPSDAKRLLERALADVRRGKRPRKTLEVELRAELGRTYLELGEKARAEGTARTLFVEGALLDADLFDPSPLLASAKVRPSPKEVGARAERQAEAGATEALGRTLAAFPTLPLCSRRKLEARALFQARSDFVLAAKAYESAEKVCSPAERPELFFLRARSLDRAQRTDEALALFAKLASQGKSLFHEHAAYALARTTLFSGRLDEAAELYAKYFRLYPKAPRHGSEARRERALLELIRGPEVRGRADADAATLREIADYGEILTLLAEARRKSPSGEPEFAKLALRVPLSAGGLFAKTRTSDSLPLPVSTRPREADFVLPESVRRLHSLGFDELAERVLESEEPFLRQAYGSRFTEIRCVAYGRIDGGRRRYQIARSELKVRDTLPIAADYRWAFECRYPRPYPEIVERAAAESKVPAALLYAVMRQESAFVRGARSPARANGLLQMIPKTAEKVARELGIEDPSLTRPDVSIRFGAHYLARLLRQFQDQLPLALAAYNAGPVAVARWAKAFEGAPTEVFLAAIPFSETRTYVARVLENYAAYAYLEGGPNALPRLSETVRASTAEDELY